MEAAVAVDFTTFDIAILHGNYLFLNDVKVFSALAGLPILFQASIISYIRLPVFSSFLGLKTQEVCCLVRMFLSCKLLS